MTLASWLASVKIGTGFALCKEFTLLKHCF